jgi:hypothetical protein
VFDVVPHWVFPADRGGGVHARGAGHSLRHAPKARGGRGRKD